jgi:ABC-type protease/lipase transport system fused ATPase/permease subunit
VGLAEVADRPGDQLSGGEQRRVALARALAPGPRLLLADEPTAHLDRLSGRRVIALLRRAVAEGGVTVITASHDPDLIAAADRDLDLGAVAYAEVTGCSARAGPGAQVSQSSTPRTRAPSLYSWQPAQKPVAEASSARAATRRPSAHPSVDSPTA